VAKQAFDTIIQGGQVVSGSGVARLDIGVRGEQVAALAPNLEAGQAQVIDAKGKYVLPGAIDVHVHPVYMDDMGATAVSAAFGGVTTMVHFGYVRPGMPFIPTLEKFRDEGEANSVLDFGLHAGLFDVENQLEHVPRAFEMGITSYKVFMTYAKLKWMTDDYHMLALMEEVASHKGLVMVHCENGLATDYLEDKFLRERRSPRETFAAMRPALLEAEATHRAMSLAQVSECPIFIVHVSAVPVLDTIRQAKAQGWRVWAETCPQYLTLTNQTTLEQGPLAKIGPPLRTPEDNRALWGGLADGTLDTVGSDHAPKDKQLEDDFFDAPYGSPQIETMLTLLYHSGVNVGHITLPRLVQVTSENPARIFGLYSQKGSLEPGADADLVLYDPESRRVISHANQHSNARYTLYEGREVIGAPTLTMQRGRVIVQDGELKTEPGTGRFLTTRTEPLYD
jgi:dihydropyrimidinase